MRRTLLTMIAAAVAFSAAADVRIVARPDGKKVISNFGSNASRRMSDYRWLAKQRNRRSVYDSIIERVASQYDVDPVFVRAVIQVESDFNPRCVSRKGARGLMQLIPETARRYGVKDVFNPAENIDGGVHYLSDLLSMFNNDLSRTLAAYNAGENAVLRYGAIPPYDETMTYVKRALTVYYGHPYGETTSYASRGGRKLTGGFTTGALAPLAVTLLPGMRYLGSH
jgi:soluble lytic murein transglycosylase-like protein